MWAKTKAFFEKVLGLNWRTNLVAVMSFLYGIPQVVTAVQNWIHGKPADWREAIAAIVVGIGFALSKDAKTHSTVEQVEAASKQVKP